MNWVLYNCAHKDASIKSADGEAWVRILGFFQSKPEALSHANKLCAIDEGTEIRIAPVGEFRILLNEKCNESTRVREVEKHAFLLDAHKKSRVKSFQETAKNAMERNMGTLVFPARERAAEHLREFSPEDDYTDMPTLVKFEDSDEIKTPPRIKQETQTPVKNISPNETLRMQRFAAMSIIPDYEHDNKIETLVNDWEKSRDAEYSKIRNAVVRESLGSRALPVFKDLVFDWVERNRPPKGFNCWGQSISNDNIWEKNDELPSSNTDVSSWLNMLSIAKDKAVWDFLCIEKPDRRVVLKDWLSQNPIPTTFSGSEPAVAFLYATDTETEMKDWIQSCRLVDADIACVVMYEWVKINSSQSAKVFKTYREPLVSQLHSNKAFQANEALKLDVNCREIVITND